MDVLYTSFCAELVKIAESAKHKKYRRIATAAGGAAGVLAGGGSPLAALLLGGAGAAAGHYGTDLVRPKSHRKIEEMADTLKKLPKGRKAIEGMAGLIDGTAGSVAKTLDHVSK